MSRKPDYSIGALDKTRNARQPKVGVAWKNENGTITIAFDPFVVLRGGPELVVTLFPANTLWTAHGPAKSKPSDEEVPF